MRGGHNRKTPREKHLAGTSRRDRTKSVVTIANGEQQDYRPPLWLKPVAVAKWEELARFLRKRGILTELTADILANACMHWELCVRCYHRISRDGPVVKNSRGRFVKHPALQVLRENSQAFRDCLTRMGMTPVDQRRVDITEEPSAEEREDEAFFGSRR